MADDRPIVQGVAPLTTSAEKLGPTKSGAHNPLEKGDGAGAASKNVIDPVGPPAEKKQETGAHMEIGQQGLSGAHNLNRQQTPKEVGKNLGIGPLSPPAESWIIDFGGTDHLTYDRTLFNSTTPPPRDSIVTANRGVASVTRAGTIALTHTLSLHNYLLIPTLSSHLLFVGQGRVLQVQGRDSGKLKTIILVMLPSPCLLIMLCSHPPFISNPDPQQKGYRCYHPPTRHVYVTMDVTFSEDELFFLPIHTPYGEIVVGEDYSWFDIPTGLSIDCPNEGPRHMLDLDNNEGLRHMLHLEDNEGPRHGLELEDNEHGPTNRPHDRDGIAPSRPLATDSPC
ncbi:hypothetical protein ACFX19_021594 [Malus domestica]